MTFPIKSVHYLGFYIKDLDGISLYFKIAEKYNKDALKL